MASFSKGTSFTDGVTGDVTAAKLHALVDAATPVAGLVTDRTAETTVASGDQVLIADASDSNTLKKMTVTNLFKTDVSITSGTGTAGTVAIGPTGDTNTGIFFPAADTIAFAEGGTEAMRIDSSGNVGIGTTSPAGKMDVYGAAYFHNIELGKGGQTGNRTVLIDFTGDNTYTDFGARISRDPDGPNSNFVIRSRGTGRIYLYSQEAGSIGFATNSTDRMIIDSSGNGVAGVDNAYTWGGASNRWSVIYSATGSINTSDINSKKDIAESTLGIDFIKSLNPVSYKFKVGGNLVSSEP